MRITLAIDDVLMAAKGLAAKEHKSVGEIISMLVRQALRPVTTSGNLHNGVPLLSVRAGTTLVTPELVNLLRDALP